MLYAIDGLMIMSYSFCNNSSCEAIVDELVFFFLFLESGTLFFSKNSKNIIHIRLPNLFFAFPHLKLFLSVKNKSWNDYEMETNQVETPLEEVNFSLKIQKTERWNYFSFIVKHSIFKINNFRPHLLFPGFPSFFSLSQKDFLISQIFFLHFSQFVENIYPLVFLIDLHMSVLLPVLKTFVLLAVLLHEC